MAEGTSTKLATRTSDKSKYAPKRTEFQIEDDRRLEAQLYLRGMHQYEIAEHISTVRPYTLSRQQIGFDLANVRKEWKESRIRDFDDMKTQELAKVDQLESTYWERWRQEPGEPKWLSGVQWCIERRSKLLGLDAPTKVAPTDPTGDNQYDGTNIVIVEH